MKTLQAILLAAALLLPATPAAAAAAPSATNDFTAANGAYLRALAAEAGVLDDPQVQRDIAEVARLAAGIDLARKGSAEAHFPLEDIHTGEVWSVCINFWWVWGIGPDCTARSKLPLLRCQGSVPVHWAYWQHLGIDIVDVPEGYHYPYTESHAGLGHFGHHHWSGTHALTACILFNAPYASVVASNGLATFDV